MSLLDKIKAGSLIGILSVYVLLLITAALAVPVGVVLIAYHLLSQ